jgi:hypothetical protein
MRFCLHQHWKNASLFAANTFTKSVEWKGPIVGINEMRRHYTNYLKGLPGIKEYQVQAGYPYLTPEAVIRSTTRRSAEHYANIMSSKEHRSRSSTTTRNVLCNQAGILIREIQRFQRHICYKGSVLLTSKKCVRFPFSSMMYLQKFQAGGLLFQPFNVDWVSHCIYFADC